MKNNINILLVDDEERIVEVVEVYLKRDGYNVFKAYDGNEAMRIYENEEIHLIILDLMLPDISGEEICKIIKSKKDTPVIMLTAKINESDVLNGFDLGADDYVVKPFSVKQLVARVSAVLRRAKIYENNSVSFNNRDLIINKESHEVKKLGRIITLTPSEYSILLMLSENITRVFTRNEIIDRVIGYDVDVFDRVIDSHIKNLRAKIEDDSREPKYILTIYGVGYKFGGRKDD